MKVMNRSYGAGSRHEYDRASACRWSVAQLRAEFEALSERQQAEKLAQVRARSPPSGRAARLAELPGADRGRGLRGAAVRVAHTGETFAYHSTKHLRNVHRLLAALEQQTREQPDCRPSVRELMQLTGLSSGGVRAALKTLRDDYGYVEQARAGGKHVERTIRLSDTAL